MKRKIDEDQLTHITNPWQILGEMSSTQGLILAIIVIIIALVTMAII